MKKFSLMTLIAGALLFATMGATSLSAEAMKCGAGKCGASMNADMKKPECCKTPEGELKKPACCEASEVGKACECPAQVACTCKDAKNCTCGTKKAPPAAMKCGTGKCG